MIVGCPTSDDLATIAQIHTDAFDGFFLTRLGGSFLREYYRIVFEYHAGVMLVSSSPHLDIHGFVAGFVNPSAFYARVRSRRLRLGIAALSGLLRRPTLLPSFVANARRVDQQGGETPSQLEAEVASIAVARSQQGRGIGRILMEAFVSRCRSLGADCVSLTTDADENDRANRFYQSLGFEISATFQAHGRRRMYRYTLPLPRIIHRPPYEV